MTLVFCVLVNSSDVDRCFNRLSCSSSSSSQGAATRRPQREGRVNWENQVIVSIIVICIVRRSVDLFTAESVIRNLKCSFFQMRQGHILIWVIICNNCEQIIGSTQNLAGAAVNFPKNVVSVNWNLIITIKFPLFSDSLYCPSVTFFTEYLFWIIENQILTCYQMLIMLRIGAFWSCELKNEQGFEFPSSFILGTERWTHENNVNSSCLHFIL